MIGSIGRPVSNVSEEELSILAEATVRYRYMRLSQLWSYSEFAETCASGTGRLALSEIKGGARKLYDRQERIAHGKSRGIRAQEVAPGLVGGAVVGEGGE